MYLALAAFVGKFLTKSFKSLFILHVVILLFNDLATLTSNGCKTWVQWDGNVIYVLIFWFKYSMPKDVNETITGYRREIQLSHFWCCLAAVVYINLFCWQYTSKIYQRFTLLTNRFVVKKKKKRKKVNHVHAFWKMIL